MGRVAAVPGDAGSVASGRRLEPPAIGLLDPRPLPFVEGRVARQEVEGPPRGESRARAASPAASSASARLSCALAERGWAAAIHSKADARYAFTQAFYLEKAGDAAGAERVLRALVTRHPGYRDGWAVLGALLEGRGRAADAADVYRRAAETAALPAADRAAFDARSRARR
jgi:hypothetical protein